jgi:glycosyltransferase involved in cell wall biosynthesis
MMKLLFIADGRSPIALNWIEYFVDAGYEVYLVSTFACAPQIELASLQIISVAFSGVDQAKLAGDSQPGAGSALRKLLPVGVRTSLRRWLAPLTLPAAARKLKQYILQLKPDLVHAMRIPFEGMLAAEALDDLPSFPLIVSVWGNDFTLHAPATPRMGRATRKALTRADALHADCQRDVRLAHQWGYAQDKMAIVLPGAGGIQMDLFYPADNQPLTPAGQERFRVVNPRGIRSYVRNDTFFRSIPLVRQHSPKIEFTCPAMLDEPQARRWVEELSLEQGVELLPRQTRPQMAELFRRAQVVVSPSEHDGTPNTLLEAMACGCFPVAGDIESIREWITPGVNGLLFDPASPQQLADAIVSAYRQPELRKYAREHNLRLVAERAEYGSVMRRAEMIYQELGLARSGRL